MGPNNYRIVQYIIGARGLQLDKAPNLSWFVVASGALVAAAFRIRR